MARISSKLLALVGVATLSYLLLRFARFIYLYALQPSALPRYRHGSKYKAWALVTGSSDGIGLGFAHVLAGNGFNVILHGRNLVKLEAVKTRLGTDFPHAQFRILVADASSSHGMKRAIEDMVSSLSDLPGPFTVLINNAGGVSMLRSGFNILQGHGSAGVDSVLNLNIRFATQLTRALMPKLTEHAPSLIMSISSVTATLGGVPYLSVYSGTKSYLLAWSGGLQREFWSEGLDMEALAIVVGQVTNVSHYKEPTSIFIPDAETMARAALARVGCGRLTVTGYWTHALQGFFVELMPEVLATRFITDATKKARANEIREQ